MTDPILVDIDARGVATVTLNRPELHNALNAHMLESMGRIFKDLGVNDDVRVVVITGAGKSFSAGADLEQMRKAGSMTYDENRADALVFADMLYTLNVMPKPTIALVNGATFGGALGVISCCDIALGLSTALFSLSEVKLGLIPAMISPYVISAIGARNSRRLMLTGERFDGAMAKEIGLLHECFDDGAALRNAEAKVVEELLKCAPGAVRAAKALIHEIAGRPIDYDTKDVTATHIATRRATAEAREGLTAFLEKRAPSWVSENKE